MFKHKKSKDVRRRSQRGQAMYEMLMVIPGFLLLFALAVQVFSIQFNAQYTHIKSRADHMNDKVKYQPCTPAGSVDPTSVDANTPGMIMKRNGARGTETTGSGQVSATAQIICR